MHHIASAFKKQGYYCPIRVCSAAEAFTLRHNLEQWEGMLEGGKASKDMRFRPHLLLPWLWDLVMKPEVLDAVEAVLGPDVLAWSSEFNIKEPHTDSFFSWHQDSTYAGLEPSDDVLTAWIALVDVNEANGCMQYIPGTHHKQLPHVETNDHNNMLSRGQTIPNVVDESSAVNVVLKAGEMSLHHFRLVHRSGPNKTDDRRIGYTIRFISKRVALTTQRKVRESITLCRGVYAPEEGNFDLDVRPDELMGEAEVARHREAMARENANYFDSANVTGYKH
ncbi:unnamed protein product [Vitrella brassicaformis CCMP3155]|uniref:Phytanoyl-CoA dioxygenase n=2 Tax=Vitrella brassicaformis TaxID=1169539 RepID=A0A0G4E8M7_VITBC|nr:unnamed protein product [Vitrella brassicaformis CCMP3155]|eukprot:CEL91712.1 unnamed protein product [Vitrella brassicaformis CCMP3155]